MRILLFPKEFPSQATPNAGIFVLRLAQALLDDEIEGGQVFHLAGDGDATWAEFAEAIFDQSASRGGKRPKVRRITTAEYPTPATRPANSRLDCSKLTAALDWPMRPW
ncbi:MAG TPA: sugar nucleotide-binding protein, partial [Candidatus Baltobacteraceae bacterium]|nr:sugar nucleotide-binding protein [Candidatus Baltobacteraceae bacterium]